MKDYSNLGLTGSLQSENSLPATRRSATHDYEYNVYYHPKVLRASKVELEDFVKISGGATAYGTFSTSQTLTFSYSLAFGGAKSVYTMHADRYIAIYQGTTLAQANQIYPYTGSSVTPGRYDVSGGPDYHLFNYYNNIQSIWTGCISDTNGTSTQVITFKIKSSYLDYVSGVAT